MDGMTFGRCAAITLLKKKRFLGWDICDPLLGSVGLGGLGGLGRGKGQCVFVMKTARIRPFANFGIFPLNGMMVKKKIISWKKSTFRAFPPGKSGRRALRARLPASHRVERRRVSFAR